jgi:hypothetical protein
MACTRARVSALTFGSLQSARDAVDFDTPAALDTSSNVTDGRTSCSLLAFVIMSLPFETIVKTVAVALLSLTSGSSSTLAAACDANVAAEQSPGY